MHYPCVLQSVFVFDVILQVFNGKCLEKNINHVKLYHIQTIFPATTATIFTRVIPN